MADENGGDAAVAEAKKVGVTMSMGKKRSAPVAGAFGEEEKKADKSQQKAQDITDLDERKVAKVRIRPSLPASAALLLPALGSVPRGAPTHPAWIPSAEFSLRSRHA